MFPEFDGEADVAASLQAFSFWNSFLEFLVQKTFFGTERGINRR